MKSFQTLRNGFLLVKLMNGISLDPVKIKDEKVKKYAICFWRNLNLLTAK